jgi:hypothetical protein
VAVVMNMHWPEITTEQYEQARSQVGWETEVPAGAVFHVAWVGDDGFHVLDVWDSADDFNRFAEERLMPVVSQLGVTTEPDIQITPAHAVFKP